MIGGVDSSSFHPTQAQVLTARNAGVRVWGGYLSNQPSNRSGIGSWNQSQFTTVGLTGSPPIAFCSGQDDPVVIRQIAAAWGVRPCLDVELGIRADGAWVQQWLDQCGAGLYGNEPVHRGRRAAFHIFSAYPGYNPERTWPVNVARPAGPVAWQWRGTHTEWGGGVDSLWLDDWFGTPIGSPGTPTTGGADDMNLSASQAQGFAEEMMWAGFGRDLGAQYINDLAGRLMQDNMLGAVQGFDAQQEVLDWRHAQWNLVQQNRAFGDAAVGTAFQFGRDWVDQTQPDGSVKPGWGSTFQTWVARMDALEKEAMTAGVDSATLAAMVDRAITQRLAAIGADLQQLTDHAKGKP